MVGLEILRYFYFTARVSLVRKYKLKSVCDQFVPFEIIKNNKHRAVPTRVRTAGEYFLKNPTTKCACCLYSLFASVAVLQSDQKSFFAQRNLVFCVKTIRSSLP